MFRKAFTLVELMVVVAIVCILAVLARVSYESYLNRSLEKEALATMYEIASQAKQAIYDWGIRSNNSDGAIEQRLIGPHPGVDPAKTFRAKEWGTTNVWENQGIHLDASQFHRWNYWLCYYYKGEEESFFIDAQLPSSITSPALYGRFTSDSNKPIFSELDLDPQKTCSNIAN